MTRVKDIRWGTPKRASHSLQISALAPQNCPVVETPGKAVVEGGRLRIKWTRFQTQTLHLKAGDYDFLPHSSPAPLRALSKGLDQLTDWPEWGRHGKKSMSSSHLPSNILSAEGYVVLRCVCVAEAFSLGLVLWNFQHLIVPWLSHCVDKACSVMSCFLIIIKIKPIGKVSSDALWGLLGLLSHFLLGEIWEAEHPGVVELWSLVTIMINNEKKILNYDKKNTFAFLFSSVPAFSLSVLLAHITTVCNISSIKEVSSSIL